MESTTSKSSQRASQSPYCQRKAKPYERSRESLGGTHEYFYFFIHRNTPGLETLALKNSKLDRLDLLLFLCRESFDTPAPLKHYCNMTQNPHVQDISFLSRLVLDGLTALGNTREDVLTVLVELELADNDVRGGNGDGDALAVGLLTDNTLDVDNPLQTVDGGDLSLTTLVASTDDCDLVVLADGDGADLLKRSELESMSHIVRISLLP